MMAYVINIIAIAGVTPVPPGPPPYYVDHYDPDFAGGLGSVTTTRDIDKALHFATTIEAWNFWKQQSVERPLREDGAPNRPLTAFTITVEAVP